MDPFTIALATFGVQKLRGKSTRTAFKDALLMGGGAYGLGQIGGIGAFQGAPFSSLGFGAGAGTTTAAGGVNMNALYGDMIAKEQMKQAGIKSVLQPTVSQRIASGFQSTGDFLKDKVIGKSADPTAYKEALERGMDIEKAKSLYGGSGFMGLDTGAKLGIGAAAATALAGDEEEPAPPFTDEDYAKAQAKAKEQVSGLTEGATYDTMGGYTSPYNYQNNPMYAFNTGGIVNALPKYNQGGINYLPSKTDHDENDVHNYVRAAGYVEDGSGNGDKDEDTILAQLADGEFVSRADAILGAGIMEGANPSNMKDMRKKGAAFFYGQQAKFKRVYDLLNASRKDN